MFDVIIPTYNNLEELKKCLTTLETQTYSSFQVFICIDGSTDSTSEFLESSNYNFKFNVLQHPDKKNHGSNNTRNLAIPYLSSEFLLMLDSDIYPAVDLLEKHYKLLKNIDVISQGEIKYTNYKTNLWNAYLQTRGKNKYKAGDCLDAFYFISQNVAFRTKYFIELKGMGLEKCTGYGGEDSVLGYRLNREFNIDLIFNETALGYCDSEKSIEEALQQLESFGNTNLKYIYKNYPEMRHYYRLKILSSNGIKGTLIKIIFNRFICNLITFLNAFSPRYLKLKLLNYLVIYRIYKGFIRD